MNGGTFLELGNGAEALSSKKPLSLVMYYKTLNNFAKPTTHKAVQRRAPPRHA